MKDIFIIGSKGMGNYGGYETFLENLTYFKNNDDINYHIAYREEDTDEPNKEFYHNGARCFKIKLKDIGPAKAIVYDVKALRESINYIKKNKINDAIIYILTCRIGPFLRYYKNKCRKLGIKIYVNPDGHEWLRAKWSKPVKKYWKLSEKLMIKYSDLVICDSKNIEKYILKNYKKYNPKTTFIAYGADINKSKLEDNNKKLVNWYKQKNVKPGEYFLVVGRFVPENNYKTIISEFMKSNTKKDLVLVTNVQKNKFYEKLKKETNFDKDNRIKFVGTVYEKELIKKIRENAFAYLHGHSVGGTNPSLIEALAATDLNLLYEVGFNKEVAENGALYWNLDDSNLADLINKVDKFDEKTIKNLSEKARKRIKSEYTWEKIVDDYQELFIGG